MSENAKLSETQPAFIDGASYIRLAGFSYHAAREIALLKKDTDAFHAHHDEILSIESLVDIARGDVEASKSSCLSISDVHKRVSALLYVSQTLDALGRNEDAVTFLQTAKEHVRDPFLQEGLFDIFRDSSNNRFLH